MSSSSAFKTTEAGATPHTIRVSDYTKTPGGRHPADGRFPGDEFLYLHLAPAFERAQAAGCVLLVDLDGTAGYASSFLEEAFGGLARRFDRKTVAAGIKIKSDDEPYLVADIQQYIDEA